MKLFFTGAILVALLSSAYSQKSPIKFGDIPLEDLKMTTYDKDSSAPAVILVDYGESKLHLTSSSTTMDFERHVRIKILSKEGLSWANVVVPLYQSGATEEKISNLRATTYNLENGKIVESKMSKESVFKEKFSAYQNRHKFTLPNVKEGSVIEYSYTIISEFYTHFPNWQFQYSIPVRHSEFWAVIPEFFVYEKYMQGYVPITTYEIKENSSFDYKTSGHHWISKNVPAFKEEPYMTCEDDYVSRINFALSHINYRNRPTEEIMGSWQKLNDDLMESENFGKVISGSGFLKKQVEGMIAGLTDTQKKVDTIYNYIKQTLEWDGTEDYLAGNLKKIFETKKGSSGDINLALAAMLDKAGINTDMVMLSTRDHGFIRKEYPMRRQFNYVICRVWINDKVVLLDATEKFLPADILPERCLNGEGLIISKINFGWINLDSKSKAKTAINVEVSLNGDGELKGKLNFTRDGYDAQRMREKMKEKGEEKYLKDFFADKSWQVEKTEFQNIKAATPSTKELHEVSISDHASVAGNTIYINPFVTSRIESNPFKLETREYPVDFGTRIEKIYFFKLILPDGYKIDELPPAKVFTLPGNSAKYSYNSSQTGNTVTVFSSLQINKSLFLQDEYPALRQFYDYVVAKQNEQISIRKN